MRDLEEARRAARTPMKPLSYCSWRRFCCSRCSLLHSQPAVHDLHTDCGTPGPFLPHDLPPLPQQPWLGLSWHPLVSPALLTSLPLLETYLLTSHSSLPEDTFLILAPAQPSMEKPCTLIPTSPTPRLQLSPPGSRTISHVYFCTYHSLTCALYGVYCLSVRVHNSPRGPLPRQRCGAGERWITPHEAAKPQHRAGRMHSRASS
jgi:hypothetical protein